MKKIVVAGAGLLALLSAACGDEDGFTAEERTVIASQQGGIMRLCTVADRQDSLLLRRRCAPLGREELGSQHYDLLRQGMLATVRNPENEGVGIAAPQVGISRRLIAVQRFDKPGEPFEFYANPRIAARSGQTAAGPEGCLSVPGVAGQVLRSRRIVVRYTDERTLRQRADTVEGFTAVIFQHEIDHLDGILFTDKMSDE